MIVTAGFPAVPTRALVVGLGTSGRAALELLQALEVGVVGYDQRPDGSLGIEIHSAFDACFEGVDVVVLSPGVDPRPVREAAAACGRGDVRFVGEMGLALEVGPQIWGRLPLALITGTNGKSTVTAMVGHVLDKAAMRPFCGGNLGEPLSAHLAAVMRGDVEAPGSLVLECSSFQLETMTGAGADAAAILNVTPDHLDRYESFEAYARAKLRIFDGCEGPCLAWDRDPMLHQLLDGLAISWIDTEDDPVENEDGLAIGSRRVPRSSIPLPGSHNARNATFAAALAGALGVDDVAIADALSTFEALPHRMNRVAEIDGITYFNDSKATNVASVVASLTGFPQPFVLIAGGKPKGDDFGPLAALLRRHGHGLVALGECADELMALDTGGEKRRASTMREAVALATELARPGHAVVLSPACASYDMYSSYVARGQDFVAAVTS